MAIERGFVHASLEKIEGKLQPDARPGRFGYFVAIAIAAAAIAACVLLIVNFLSTLDAGAQFIAPGSHAFVIEHPGKQLVWNDYRTVYQGRAYDLPERLPDGMRIAVTESSSGRTMEVKSSRGASSKTAEAERVSIASFEASAPGRYEIAIEGEFPPRVFSVGPDFLPRLFLTLLGAVCAMLLGLTVAVGVALWTFLRRNPINPASKPAGGASVPPRPAPPAKSREQAAKELATVVYALQAASFLLIFSLVAGVIVNCVTRREVAGTWVESHYRWQMRTFWWWLAWLLVGLVLLVVVVGLFVWLADAIWLSYRIIKGWIRLSEGKPMYSKP